MSSPVAFLGEPSERQNLPIWEFAPSTGLAKLGKFLYLWFHEAVSAALKLLEIKGFWTAETVRGLWFPA